jgi:hypothetical protein
VAKAKKTGSSPGAVDTPSDTGAFAIPDLAEGYTRFQANTVHDIQPGDDLTHCQYVAAPIDHDVDIVDISGMQSRLGHHAVAFSYVPSDGQEVGAEVPCMTGNTEFSMSDMGGGVSGGGYLGAVGPSAGKTVKLPEGVAFRLKKGQGIMLNVHYINTTLEPADGDSYLDLKLAEPDATRKIAALFLNLNAGFSLPPSAEADSQADCVAKSDVEIIMMSNHMHEYGTHATTDVVRADGTVEMLRYDPTWTTDMVNAPEFSSWKADAPFTLRAGDTIRTNCSWQNTTSETMTFPREMCISAGFALATGDDPKAPACFNGLWIAQGI